MNMQNFCGVKARRDNIRNTSILGSSNASTDWYMYAIPTYNQIYPSCVGHGTANALEMMIRKHIDKKAFEIGEQLDGDVIWRRGREMFWKNEPVESGGLYVSQGVDAAVDLGLLPHGSKATPIGASVSSVRQALSVSPVLQGTSVHDGWGSPDVLNGYIPAIIPDPFAGHCTVIVAVEKTPLSDYVVFQNSWGPKWGRYGYGTIEGYYWAAQCLMDSPCSISLPIGWEEHVSKNYRKFITRI